DRQNVFFLLDTSDSVSLAARESGFRYATAALQGIKTKDRAGLIAFGAEPQLLQPLQPKPTFTRPGAVANPRSTNIARAIPLALASFPPGEANRLLALSHTPAHTG